jgi:hypothetical protein
VVRSVDACHCTSLTFLLCRDELGRSPAEAWCSSSPTNLSLRAVKPDVCRLKLLRHGRFVKCFLILLRVKTPCPHRSLTGGGLACPWLSACVACALCTHGCVRVEPILLCAD